MILPSLLLYSSTVLFFGVVGVALVRSSWGKLGDLGKGGFGTAGKEFGLSSSITFHGFKDSIPHSLSLSAE